MFVRLSIMFVFMKPLCKDPLMDFIYIWHDGRYRSKVLITAIPVGWHDLVTDIEFSSYLEMSFFFLDPVTLTYISCPKTLLDNTITLAVSATVVPRMFLHDMLTQHIP